MRPPLVPRASVQTRVIVTPIIDVALTLDIIMLVTAPMVSLSDLEVQLPPAHTRDMEERGFVSITVDRAGRIAVEDRIARRPEEVAGLLRDRLGEIGRPDALVVIRADSELPHSLVRRVMQDARAGGAHRLAMATRQTGGQLP